MNVQQQDETPATREEAIARYRPVRAAIQAVLPLAVGFCDSADLTRAAKQMGLWFDGEIVIPEFADLDDEAEDEEAGDDEAGDDDPRVVVVTSMLADVALFEPNQRGRRVFDKFLDRLDPGKTNTGKPARVRSASVEAVSRLGEGDRALAERMARSFFSIFRIERRHETAGLWLADLLDGERQVWLMDEALEGSAPEGEIIGMRLFDAGGFHAGYGVAVPVSEEMLDLCLNYRGRDGRLPLREPLSARLYGDFVTAHAQPEIDEDEFLDVLLEALDRHAAAPRERSAPAKRGGTTDRRKPGGPKKGLKARDSS